MGKLIHGFGYILEKNKINILAYIALFLFFACLVFILYAFINLIIACLHSKKFYKKRLDKIYDSIKSLCEKYNIPDEFENFISLELKDKMFFNEKQKEDFKKIEEKTNKIYIINDLTYLKNYIDMNYSDINVYNNNLSIILVYLNILLTYALYQNDDFFKILSIFIIILNPFGLIIFQFLNHIKIKDNLAYKEYLSIYLEYVNILRNNIINLYEEEQKENNHIIKETKNIQNIYNINLSGQYKDEDIEALKNIAKEDNQTIKIYIWNK